MRISGIWVHWFVPNCSSLSFWPRLLTICQLWNMLEGTNTNLFANIHSIDGKYMAQIHLAQMIALFGPPPNELIMREQRMRNWNFVPAIENNEHKLCHKAYEFYHGPFFDNEGNIPNNQHLFTTSLIQLCCLQESFCIRILFLVGSHWRTRLARLEGRKNIPSWIL